jgi:hypothetical protein
VCVQAGWVRAVDQQARAEVAALLRAEPVTAAVGEEFWDDREIDFTPAGAALYRQLAGAWLGPGWEDDLHAYAEQHREEHHYTTATSPDEEYIRHLAEKHPQKKMVVRVVPIGPWCIYWWDRHPAGSRIEIEESRL